MENSQPIIEICPISMWMRKDPLGRWTAGVMHTKHGEITRLQAMPGERFGEFQDRVIGIAGRCIELCNFCEATDYPIEEHLRYFKNSHYKTSLS